MSRASTVSFLTSALSLSYHFSGTNPPEQLTDLSPETTWITQRFNARDRSKFDYAAGFEQLLDEVLSVVQIINNAEEVDLGSRR